MLWHAEPWLRLDASEEVHLIKRDTQHDQRLACLGSPLGAIRSDEFSEGMARIVLIRGPSNKQITDDLGVGRHPRPNTSTPPLPRAAGIHHWAGKAPAHSRAKRPRSASGAARPVCLLSKRRAALYNFSLYNFSEDSKSGVCSGDASKLLMSVLLSARLSSALSRIYPPTCASGRRVFPILRR